MRPCTFLAFFAVSACLLLLLSAGAEATVITAPEGTIATPTINAESVGYVVLDNPIADIACASAVEVKIEKHGKAVTAEGGIGTLSFSSCGNEWHVTVITPGVLELHWTAGARGTLTSTGATIEATRAGTSCFYKTEHTDIGSITAGSPARFHIEAKIPFHRGSGLCGEGATTWTGTYRVTSPSSLYVDDSSENPSSQLTSPTGTIATPTIKAESEGHLALDHPLASFECQWVI